MQRVANIEKKSLNVVHFSINMFLSKYQKWITTNNNKTNTDTEIYTVAHVCTDEHKPFGVNNNSETENSEKTTISLPCWNIINEEENGYNNSLLLDDYHHLILYHQFNDVYDNLSEKCYIYNDADDDDYTEQKKRENSICTEENHLETDNQNDEPPASDETEPIRQIPQIECICLERTYRDRTLKDESLSLYFGETDNEIKANKLWIQSIVIFYIHMIWDIYWINKKQIISIMFQPLHIH